MNDEQLDRYVAELTLADAERILAERLTNANAGIEAEYSNFAQCVYEYLKNNAWLDMRYKWITPERFDQLMATYDNAITTLYNAV